jgi:TM2 domain-containing membrane protein YozV
VTVPQYPQEPSDKSKFVAGLWQMVPAALFGLGGIGRLYAGHTSLGLIQLGVTILGWISFVLGFVLGFTWIFFALAWLWFIIDGVVLMTGHPVDGQGRPMRG